MAPWSCCTASIFSIRRASDIWLATRARSFMNPRMIKMFICTARSLRRTEETIATPCSVKV
jgi:hypothetical protein